MNNEQKKRLGRLLLRLLIALGPFVFTQIWVNATPEDNRSGVQLALYCIGFLWLFPGVYIIAEPFVAKKQSR